VRRRGRTPRVAALAVAVVAVAVLGVVLAACGGDDGTDGPEPVATTGDLTIRDAFVGTFGATSAALYLVIDNSGEVDDVLVGASSPDAATVAPMGAMAPGSTSPADGAGVVGADATAIPAGGSLGLGPGGAHLMVEGLRAPLEPGDTLRLRLEFEHAPAVDLDAEVVDVADIPDRMAGD
jgi:copper(I)-binding protein